MARLADLYYEPNKDCNLKVYSKGNFNSRTITILSKNLFDAER